MTRKGFTLIETLIYTMIVSMIIGSFLLILYNLAGSVDRTLRNVDLSDQKQFIIQKADWALQSVSVVNSPSAGFSGTSISINKVGYGSNPVVVDLVGGVLRMSEGGGVAVPLTPVGITVSNLSFTHTVTVNETRIRMTATIANVATSTAIDFTKIIK